MPRRDNRSRKQRARRASAKRPVLTEYFTFSVKAGESQNIPKSVLTSLPAGRDFRTVSLRTESIAWLPYLSVPGSMTPGAIQLQLVDPAANSVAVSRVQMTGSVPRALSVGYPRSADWFPSGSSGSTLLGIITAECIANMGGDTYQRGIAYITYEVSSEIVTATCPSAHLGDSPGPSCSNVIYNVGSEDFVELNSADG